PSQDPALECRSRHMRMRNIIHTFLAIHRTLSACPFRILQMRTGGADGSPISQTVSKRRLLTVCEIGDPSAPPVLICKIRKGQALNVRCIAKKVCMMFRILMCLDRHSSAGSCE